MLEGYENGMLLLGGKYEMFHFQKKLVEILLLHMLFRYWKDTRTGCFCWGEIREVPLPEESCIDIITAYVTLP